MLARANFPSRFSRPRPTRLRKVILETPPRPPSRQAFKDGQRLDEGAVFRRGNASERVTIFSLTGAHQMRPHPFPTFLPMLSIHQCVRRRRDCLSGRCYIVGRGEECFRRGAPRIIRWYPSRIPRGRVLWDWWHQFGV